MKLCRASTGEDSSQKFPDLLRKLCRSSTVLVELQEDSSQKFTDLWMELSRARTGGDSSQKFMDL